MIVQSSVTLPQFVDAAAVPPFSFNPSPYYGALVVTIEGVPAWTYMLTWSKSRAGGFHDPGQKLNYAFAQLRWRKGVRSPSYGAFGTRYFNPGKDSVSMTVIR